MELRSVLEADVMFHRQMKEKIEKEYLRRVRKVEQSKLNTWAASLYIYMLGDNCMDETRIKGVRP